MILIIEDSISLGATGAAAPPRRFHPPPVARASAWSGLYRVSRNFKASAIDRRYSTSASDYLAYAAIRRYLLAAAGPARLSPRAARAPSARALYLYAAACLFFLSMCRRVTPR